MSFANFGIGLGAFAQGLTQGMQLGNQIKTVRDQQKVRDTIKGGMDNAKAARASAIDNLVQVGSAANPSDTMTVPTYQVEGQAFNDAAGARKAAESRVGSVMDYFYQNEAPKIAELYMEQGDVEKAETWSKWINDKQVKKGFELGVKAYQAASIGDDEGAVKYMMKMYNAPGYFEDGRKATGYKPVKAEDGSVTGYAITVKDGQGNEQILNVNKGPEMIQAITPFVDPKSVYDQAMGEIRSAQQMRAQQAQDERKFRRDIYRDDRRAANQSNLQSQRDEASLNRTVTGKQMDAAARQAEIAMKAQAGELFRKNTHPDEAVKQIFLAAKKASVGYDGKPTRSDEELIAEARAAVQAIYQQPQNPMSGGIGGQAPAGAMIYDTQTGQMVPLRR
jgi:hypothetical protein